MTISLNQPLDSFSPLDVSPEIVNEVEICSSMFLEPNQLIRPLVGESTASVEAGLTRPDARNLQQEKEAEFCLSMPLGDNFNNPAGDSGIQVWVDWHNLLSHCHWYIILLINHILTTHYLSSIFSCQCDSSNICIATSGTNPVGSTSAIEDDSQIRICLTSNELIQDITFLQITQTDADGIESITEPEILFSVSPDDPSLTVITLPNTDFVQGSATVFGVLSLNNDAEESFQLDLQLSSPMDLNSESSSECFYALLLCFLSLFACFSLTSFLLPWLSVSCLISARLRCTSWIYTFHN